MYLVNINVFAMFDEIPSLPVQDIDKIKCCRRTDGQCGNRIPPHTQFAGGIMNETILLKFGVNVFLHAALYLA